MRTTHEPRPRAGRWTWEALSGTPPIVEEIDATSVWLSDGSRCAVVESPAFDWSDGVVRPDRWRSFLGRIAHPVQLVIDARPARAAVAASSAPIVRLRDSYERLLAQLWPDARTPGARFYGVVRCAPADLGSLDAQVLCLSALLEDVGLEHVRLSGPAIAELTDQRGAHEDPGIVRINGGCARVLVVTDAPPHLRSWPELRFDGDLAVSLSLHLRPYRAGDVRAALCLTIWSSADRDLRRATRHARSTFAARSIRCRQSLFDALPAYTSALPLGIYGDDGWLRLSSRSAASLISSFVTKRFGAVLIGIEPGSRRPLLLDHRSLAEHNTVVLGANGSGKTTLLGTQLLRARLAGADVRVVDPSGGATTLVRAIGGLVRETAGFDRPTDGAESRYRTLIAAIELLLEGLSEDQATALEDALAVTSALRGSDTCPTALVEEAIAGLERQIVRAWGRPKAELVELRHRLQERWNDCSTLFRAPVPNDDAGRLVAHDLTGLAPDLRSTASLLAVSVAVSAAAASERQPLVMADDVGGVLAQPGAARWVADLLRSGGGIWLNLGDLAPGLLRPLRDDVASDTTVVLLRQEPNRIADIGELLHLPPAEQSWLVRARPGEGLVVLPDRRFRFELVMSEEERRLITRGGDRR